MSDTGPQAQHRCRRCRSTLRGGGTTGRREEGRRRAAAILLLLALVMIPRTLPAQMRGDPLVDSSFHLVGTNITDADIARDSLGLDLVRFYHTGSPEELLRLIAHPRDAYEEHAARFYRRAMSNGLRVIAPIPGWLLDLNRIRAVESYAKVDGRLIDNLPLYDVHGGPPYDTLLHGLAFGVTVPATGRDTLVAGRPSYLAQNIFHRGDERVYARLGIPDRSTWFRVGVTIAIDTADPRFAALSPDALLGYLHLYRRVRAAQRTCRCNIYEKYDSLAITKRLYLASEHAEREYRDVGWTLDFARGATTVVRDTTEVELAAGGRGVPARREHLMLSDPRLAIDTIPGRVVATLIDTIGRRRTAVGETLLLVERDSIQRYQVMLAEPRADAWQHGAPGSWFGYAPGSCDRFCDSLIRSGRFGSAAIREYVEAGDFDMKLYSTGRLPMRFLRTRINQDLYDRLRHGDLDTLIRVSLARFLRSDTLRRLLGAVAFDDEVTHHKYRSHGELARRLGRIARELGDTGRAIWQNPQGNFDGFRLLTGDLDEEGSVRLIVRQDYSQIGALDDPIPIRYPNPDSLSWWAAHRIFSTDTTFLRNGGETRVRWSLIAPNTIEAYHAYNERRQRSFGAFRDASSPAAVKQGALVTTLARAVDVAKVRYRSMGAAPVPVWNSIQDMGWQTEASPRREEPGGAYNPWGLRIPTPEEITAQAWLSLNCGVDGLVYTDAQYDGVNVGFVGALDGAHDREYGDLRPANGALLLTRLDSLTRTQPGMWIGLRSRFDAVARVNRELRLLDSIIGLRRLRFVGEQLSAHDARQSFGEIPLLDTLHARQARRYARGERGGYIDSTAVDPRGETWMEVTHFLPPASDMASGVHYYLITNRRCWPVDTLSYGAGARAFGSGARGLGAIDVRRPVVRLRGAPGSRFIVTKVGHEGEWPTRAVRAGELLELDWLEPGWGGVYRVKEEGPG